MIKNTRIIYPAIVFVTILFLASVILSILLFQNVTREIYSIILLVLGAIELSAIFVASYLLKTEETSVTDDEDDAYFRSLVPAAQENPVAFGLKIQWIVLMSKLYMALLLIASVQTIAGTLLLGTAIDVPARVMFIVTIVLGAIVILLFKALLYRPAYPNYPAEIEAKMSNFPNLNALVRKVQKKAKAPKVHHIYVVPGDNCGVSMYSDFFGIREKNIMVIGASLLNFCSEEELEALLAHELAHIGNKDTYIGHQAQINMLRWDFLRKKVSGEHQFIRLLLGKFAVFYTGLLSIHLAAISKPHEYAADALAAKITSPAQFAAMLYKIMFLSKLDSEPIDLFKINDENEIPKNFFSADINNTKVHTGIGRDDFNKNLFSEQSDAYDSHPSFAERLKSLGLETYEVRLDLSACTPFDRGCTAVLEYFDRDWHEETVIEWKQLQEQKFNDEEIVNQFSQDFEDVRTCMMVGWALLRLRRNVEAIDLFQKLADLYPDEDYPRYAVGLAQLQNGEEEGLKAVMDFADMHAYEINDAAEAIYNFFVASNQKERLGEMEAWFNQKRKIEREYNRELNEIRSTDLFMSVVTPPYKTMKPFYAELAKLKRIKAIYFLRKKCTYAGKGPLLVGIDVGLADTSKKDVALVEALLDKIMPDLDFEGYITQTYEHDMRFFVKHFMGSKGNEVYNRRRYLKQMRRQSS